MLRPIRWRPIGGQLNFTCFHDYASHFKRCREFLFLRRWRGNRSRPQVCRDQDRNVAARQLLVAITVLQRHAVPNPDFHARGYIKRAQTSVGLTHQRAPVVSSLLIHTVARARDWL